MFCPEFLATSLSLPPIIDEKPGNAFRREKPLLARQAEDSAQQTGQECGSYQDYRAEEEFSLCNAPSVVETIDVIRSGPEISRGLHPQRFMRVQAGSFTYFIGAPDRWGRFAVEETTARSFLSQLSVERIGETARFELPIITRTEIELARSTGGAELFADGLAMLSEWHHNPHWDVTWDPRSGKFE